jgi:hypothetical protein
MHELPETLRRELGSSATLLPLVAEQNCFLVLEHWDKVAFQQPRLLVRRAERIPVRQKQVLNVSRGAFRKARNSISSRATHLKGNGTAMAGALMYNKRFAVKVLRLVIVLSVPRRQDKISQASQLIVDKLVEIGCFRTDRDD